MKFKTLLLLTSFIVFLCSLTIDARGNLTKYVDPFIGTSGHGHTFPGATMPFGMVQLSPDTGVEGWDWCSGYHASDSSIIGFSHTHLSGTGAPEYGDILFMPAIGKLQLKPGTKADPKAGYRSRFRHESEEASPGYYAVYLLDYDIHAEFTATERAGFHRYTFPESDSAHIIIDLKHALGNDKPVALLIEVLSDTEIAGFRKSQGWAREQDVFFYSKFSKPFRDFGLSVDGKVQPGLKRADGKNIQAYVNFATSKAETVLVKAGISAVDIKGAKNNLDIEIPGWDFDATRRHADRAWNKTLGNIRVESDSQEKLKTFYTSLYHAHLAPNLFMEIDGSYRGINRKVYQAEDFTNYTVFSFWDTFRAQHPLMTILQPQRTADFIKTLLKQYDEGGKLPQFELAGNYAGAMIGYHAVAVIYDAYAKGIVDFDEEKALQAMKESAEENQPGMEYYKTYGFIPLDQDLYSVSKTVEISYDDWCIAQMAKDLNRPEDYSVYFQRARNYRNLFDTSSGFFRGRYQNGLWRTPFGKNETSVTGTPEYVEGNAWQYTFFVPQDVNGLISLFGGDTPFLEKLDQFFYKESLESSRLALDVTETIGQYAHGNEPSHHIAYLYNYAGAPWKTQKIVFKILDELYSSRRDGLCGNDDCGQMSAWYVFSAMGFYPVCPGSNEYVIGAPLFDKVTINLDNGKQFRMIFNKLSRENRYIQTVTKNGQNYPKTYLTHNDILNGSEFTFEMGPEPNKNWGTDKANRPHSSLDDKVPNRKLTQAFPPYFSDEKNLYLNKKRVALACLTAEADIRYSINGENPTQESSLYKEPIIIDKNCTVKARAFKAGLTESPLLMRSFIKAIFKDSSGSVYPKIQLSDDPLPKYTAGGNFALIDGILGSENFFDGKWQAFRGANLDALIDLGIQTPVHRITARFLQNIDSWIFPPTEVSISVSNNGEDFRKIAEIIDEIHPEDREVKIKRYFKELSGDGVRYIRVFGRNIGVIPHWHSGAGGSPLLFADEIIIE